MNGRDFLPTARHLAVGATEADWRSSASRTYYATFHAARDLLSALRFAVPRADRAHEYLYFRLNNSGHGDLQRSAGQLHDLRTLRNQADYDVRRPFAAVLATQAVAMADTIFHAIDALAPADLVQITDAMKLYEQGIGDVTWQP